MRTPQDRGGRLRRGRTQRRPTRTSFSAAHRRWTAVWTGVLAAIAVSACDESFTPIETSELQYSVYGHLDAAADTQWIRVMPIRPVVTTSPGALQAAVLLEQLGTGQRIELRDSVFRFPPHPELGSDGVFLHNFWTTETIEPGATYRFSVGRGGETSSEAVVDIPADYEVEVWLRQLWTRGSDLLRLIGLNHLVVVESRTYYEDDCGPGVSRRTFQGGTADTDGIVIPVIRVPVASPDCGAPYIEKRELFIVGSAAAWPSGPEFSPGSLGVSQIPSNITNSVGFLGGVLTKVIPFEECRIESPTLSDEYCRLRYDTESAVLRGRVTDATCFGQHVVDATVELREIDPSISAGVKVRHTLVKRSGEFRIDALEAGTRYEIKVDRETENVLHRYHPHTDTLELASGEQVRYDVELRRVFPC